MPTKRISLHVDPHDLALIAEAARHRGLSMAEILREGVRVAALSNRVWDEPLAWPTFDGGGEPASLDYSLP